MIISVKQNASNIAQKFDIFIDNCYSYSGELGSYSRFQPIRLIDKNGQSMLVGKYFFSHWTHYLPLRYLFGKVNLTKGYRCINTGNDVGTIVYSHHGFLKSFYVMTWHNEVLYSYPVTKGSFEYVAIYNGAKQIALLEIYLTVTDFKYCYKLYLLDDFREWEMMMSFFILYYANRRFAKRFHMSKGTTCVKAWSFSKYNNQYDPQWRETHFPQENFFGKTTWLNS